jgi:hypothetical protein
LYPFSLPALVILFPQAVQSGGLDFLTCETEMTQIFSRLMPPPL